MFETHRAARDIPSHTKYLQGTLGTLTTSKQSKVAKEALNTSRPNWRFENVHVPVPRQRPLLWLSIVCAYAEPPPARADVSGFEKYQNRPQGDRRVCFGHID
jgi:hypothetical protein